MRKKAKTLSSSESRVRKISVIHGEESQALAFGETLRQLYPQAEVNIPEYQQVLEF
jgi:hypothetical protein